MQAKQFRKKGNHNRPTSCSDKNSHCVKGFSSNRYPEHQKGWFNEHQCWVTDVIFKRSSGEGVTLQEDKLTESDSRTGKWKVNWPCLNFSLTWIPSDDACRKVANLYWKTQVLNHGTAATVPVLRKFWSFWRCLYTTYYRSGWVRVLTLVQPHLWLFFVYSYSGSLASTIGPFLLVQSVEWRQSNLWILVESFVQE